MNTGTTAVIRQALQGLDEDTLQLLRQVAKRVEHPPNTTLCHQGKVEHVFYVVVKGNVAVVRVLDSGEERILNMVGKNGYFGEMGLIDDSPRAANCVTITPTTVLEVTEEAFDKFVKNSPSLANVLLQRILSNARNLDKIYIEDLQQKNEALELAYERLKAAQAKLVEQERLQRELELAAQVQRNLLQEDLPQFPDYHFAAYLEPARQVGGDFYDVLAIDDEHVGVLIADVADKGFHAALFMAVTRTLFLQEGRRSISPAAVALAVHRGMFEVANNDEVFLTAFYGVLHRPSGKLTYIRAAHERPLLLRPGREVMALPGGDRFLGMMPDLELTEQTIKLEPGDRLVMFSDGVPDAVNESDQGYGNQQLSAAVANCSQKTAAEIVDFLVKDVARWQGKAAPFDDLTLLVLEAK
ncbi:MAG: SpoIIE family protein phosphatase [Ardenticatenaceae bacterium]|nr:SpoIIE family protein phosphatase [Ardenticatenaceae bacterium]MCB8973002.1 SpoIIE family protein phosphatase [Ardenticatenaceae bacterium]